jgi:DNA-binding MarR family transcriptional regulator
LAKIKPHQSPHDRVLWELASHGKMTRGLLRQRIGMKQAELDIILGELEKEGRIKRTIGKHGELISLKD